MRTIFALFAAMAVGASAAHAAAVSTDVKELRDLLNSDVHAPLTHTKTVATQSGQPESMLAEYMAVAHSRTPFHEFSFAADPAAVATGRTYGTLSREDEATVLINQAQGLEGMPYNHIDEAKDILDDLLASGAQLGYDADGRTDNGTNQVILLIIDTAKQKVYGVETFPLVD